MLEEWKTIIDYPNYSISSLGVVRNDKNLIMKSSNRNGYLRIGLSKDGINKFYSHHQLMGKHFIQNPQNYPEVDHINGITNDNRLENLRWASRSQNCRNKKKKANCSSQFLGVSLKANKWIAYISINGKKKHLGYFATELEAFNAWKAYVIENGLQEFYSQTDFQ
jgi:hypothetical protein